MPCAALTSCPAASNSAWAWRALVQAPQLLLADEPVASLDPATAERLLAQMHEICKTDGLTAIVSLHQLEFARQFADRIVGLAAGAVVFDGAPSTLGSDAVSRLYGATEARAPGDQTTQTFNLESAAA